MKQRIITLFLLTNMVLSLFATNRVSELKDSLKYFSGIKKAQTLLQIGNYYYSSNNDSALTYIEQSLHEYEKVNDEKGTVSCYGLIGDIYAQYCMYDTAIVLIYKVKEWGEKNNDIRAYIAYLNLANTYQKLGQNEKAREFYLKAIGGRYLPAKRAAFANLGLLYLSRKDYDSAHYYYEEGLKEYVLTDTSLSMNKYNIASIYLNIATVYYEKKEYEKGIKSLNNSLKLFKQIDNYSSIASVYNNMGNGYQCLNEDEMALRYYLKAKNIIDSFRSLSIKEQIFKSLSDYYIKKNDYKKAYTYVIEYEKTHDSLMIQSYKTSIAELEVKYSVQEKMNKIDSLNKEKRIVFSTAAILVLSLLSISSIIILFLNQKRLKQKNARTISDAKAHMAELATINAKKTLERMTLNLQEKSAFIEELQNEIEKLGDIDDQQNMEKKIQHLRSSRILTVDDWKEYYRIFNEIHPSFDKRIEHFDILSVGDKRQLIFLKLGLKQKEIAYLMGISFEGVKRARQRLSKKIGLDSTAELSSFIDSL